MPATWLLVLGVSAVFTGLLVALIAAGALRSEPSGQARSLNVLEAYSSAPASMRGELEPDFSERILNPLMGRLTGLGRRLTPADNTERLRRKLDAAGNPPGMTTDRLTAFKGGGFLGALLLGLVITMLIGLALMPTMAICVAAALAGYYAPNLWLYQKAHDRAGQTQRDLPDALDLLTISVEAGLGFDAALAQVARNTQGPLAQELARVLQEMQLGAGRSEALRSLAERSSLPELKNFVTSMVQADAFGIPIGRVLRVQGKEMRDKRRQRAEEKAQKVPVKILFPLIFCILPTLFIAVMGPAVISMMSAFSGAGL
jgi:tight adherence protein C